MNISPPNCPMCRRPFHGPGGGGIQRLRVSFQQHSHSSHAAQGGMRSTGGNQRLSPAREAVNTRGSARSSGT